MTTTGIASFSPDLGEIIEEAFEMCGLEARTGYDFRTARRSINLLTISWANKGINLWTIDQGSQLLTPGTATYAIPTDTIDLLDQVIRTGTGTNQLDINMGRISSTTYATIPSKNTTGRPVQVWINRQASAPSITVWPVPDSSTPYTFVYWRLRRIQDAGDAVNTPDIPFRFLPAFIAGLAFHLSVKLPGVDPQRAIGLKALYDEAFQQASEEDREKSDYHAVPRMYR